MRYKKVKVGAILLLGIGLTELQAQQAIPAAGGNATTGSGGSASYSVGQVVYNTISGTGGSEAQGVQQPFEISVATGFETVQGITLQCSAFPNPTKNNLTLKIDDAAVETSYRASLQCTLFDITGKQLLQQTITGNETSISMEQYPAATYILKVTNNNTDIKTFTIIKN